MNITKKKISSIISTQEGLSIEESKNFVNSFFLIKAKSLKSYNLKINKLGSFYKKTTPQRTGRNPKTLEEYLIPKKSRVSFKPSKLVKKILN